MDDVVESDPGDDLRSLVERSAITAPREEVSRSEEGVRGAMVDGGDRKDDE